MNASGAVGKIGRVVIELRFGTPNAVAMQEALHMASAFGCELEGLFISDAALDHIAGLSVARSISASGRKIVNQVSTELAREIFLSSQSMRREFDQLASRADLKHQFKTVRDQPIRAILNACTEGKAASILVLSETLPLKHIAEIDELLKGAPTLQAVLLVGPGAKRRAGPVVIVPEKTANVPNMFMAAEVLAKKDQQIIIFLSGEDAAELSRRSEKLQEILPPSNRLNILTAVLPQGQPAVMTEAIRRLRGGLVIAEYGGRLMPCRENIVTLATALECPLMISKLT